MMQCARIILCSYFKSDVLTNHPPGILYLDTVGDGFGDQRHIGLHLGERDAGEQWSIIVVAPKLPHHK